MTVSQQFITIVSGLPRSGTSMMMKMLEAGGIPLLTDQQRQPDADNPEGYYELEVVKKLGDDVAWLADAEGKAVKIISQLLIQLPVDAHQYRVLLMERTIDEVLASQAEMLKRRGTDRAARAGDDDALRSLFERHLEEVRQWLRGHDNFDFLSVQFDAVHANPTLQSERVSEFFGGGLDIPSMAAAVNKRLYRQKSSSRDESPLGVV